MEARRKSRLRDAKVTEAVPKRGKDFWIRWVPEPIVRSNDQWWGLPRYPGKENGVSID